MRGRLYPGRGSFSTLQRVEIAEMRGRSGPNGACGCFSTLQRVEIAEIERGAYGAAQRFGFSTLQRVEIAEIRRAVSSAGRLGRFQYSSTSRNCRNFNPDDFVTVLR